jgi:methanogenic corrinoid protein MtbC1
MRYTVKAAAIATGVSESRLRTWERRYGVPRPSRSDTGRRLYSEEDLEVIRRMWALVSRGVPASEAATVTATETGRPPEDGQLEQEHPTTRAIVRAAAGYDELALVAAIADAASSLGMAGALDQVLMPGLRRVGSAWEDETIESSNEHFATEVVRREISRWIADSPAVEAGAPTVVLACPEDERHDLGLLGLALLLKRKGFRVVYLGADVPAADVARAVQDLRPQAVCIAAVLPGSVASAARALRALATGRQQPRLFVGGPALATSDAEAGLPAVRLPQSLADAAEVIVNSIRKR